MARHGPSSSRSSFGANPPTGSRMKNPYNNPFYLHPNDNPGTQLITRVLDGNNYVDWSRLMQKALNVKNKLGFINGNIIEPKVDSPTFNVWKRCNDMVISWITNALTPAIYYSVVQSTNAALLWDDLYERFSKSNGPLIHQLKRDIIACVQGSDTIATYHTNLKRLWDQYDMYNSVPDCSCGALKELQERGQNEKAHQFLMGLNESFAHLRGRILLMMPLPTVSKIQSLCLRVEERGEPFTKADTV